MDHKKAKGDAQATARSNGPKGPFHSLPTLPSHVLDSLERDSAFDSIRSNRSPVPLAAGPLEVPSNNVVLNDQALALLDDEKPLSEREKEGGGKKPLSSPLLTLPGGYSMCLGRRKDPSLPCARPALQHPPDGDQYRTISYD